MITTKDGQKIDVQTLSTLTRPPETVEGDIKVTNIDATGLTGGQIIHIPAAQSAQPTVQPITITGQWISIHAFRLFSYLSATVQSVGKRGVVSDIHQIYLFVTINIYIDFFKLW